jgi:acyl dehydratase
MSDIREKTIEGLRVGDMFSVSRTFTEQDVIRFAEISRDYNPVHFDERFAEAKTFGKRICHGLLVGSLVTEIGGQIGWLASGMTFSFKKPVYFGERIRCDFTVTDIADDGRAKAEAVFRNDHEVTVLEATLTGVIPGSEEKKILKAMMTEEDARGERS